MNKISAVVSTHNEERNIGNCLETLLWCDEIIVVDMESEDATVEIARRYTDQVYSHPKVAAFDIAKKFAVEKASNPWVLLIDADEMVPVVLAEKLREITGEGSCDVVMIPFRHLMLGATVRHSGWGYTPLPRFFRNGTVSFSGRVHNYMSIASEARVFTLAPRDENCIVHFNYLDAAHFVQKLNAYTNVEAQELYERRVPFTLFSLLFSALGQFSWRFIRNKGYRDGVLGFHLSLMMAFYKALVHVKLWELHANEKNPVSDSYDRIRKELLMEWRR